VSKYTYNDVGFELIYSCSVSREVFLEMRDRAVAAEQEALEVRNVEAALQRRLDQR
jgi:hypothetical protein